MILKKSNLPSDILRYRYTYGIAGAFWLYDAWVFKGGFEALKTRWPMTGLSVATLAAGAFICVAGVSYCFYPCYLCLGAGDLFRLLRHVL